MNRITLSTNMLSRHLSAEQKARCWADVISGQGAIDVDCPNPAGFKASIDLLDLGDVSISQAYAMSVRVVRDRRHIARDANDNLTILLCNGTRQLGGRQGAREVVLRRGDAFAYWQAMPSETFALGGGHALAVSVARSHLAQFVADPEAQAGQLIDQNFQPLMLLQRYISAVLSDTQPLSPLLKEAVARHVTELAALALGGAHDLPHAGDGARYHLLMKAIGERSSDPAVDASTIGAGLRLSERSVQLLLQRAGTTFGRELRRARLANAEAMLQDPALRHLSIAEIALMAGFNDLSTFYRAFRQRGGPSPSDLRGSVGGQ